MNPEDAMKRFQRQMEKLGLGVTLQVGSDEPVEVVKMPPPPYPQFCRTPAKCAGRGSCPADPACND